VAAGEKVLVTAFVAAIFALILLNIATRAAGRPLIWVDELAIYLMVATCFIGTSLTVRQRLDFAVTLVIDTLGQAKRKVVDATLTAIGLAYGLFLVVLCWRLFDPVQLARSGFDIVAYTAASLNFLYTDPTQTLGIPKWVALLVLPLYAVGVSIHCVANLVEDLGWAEREQIATDSAATLEAG
jgi:TRAP-type C4-dicarboxylate transport system permease small subunit